MSDLTIRRRVRGIPTIVEILLGVINPNYDNPVVQEMSGGTVLIMMKKKHDNDDFREIVNLIQKRDEARCQKSMVYPMIFVMN